MRKRVNAGLAAVVIVAALASCQVKVDGVATVTGPSEVSEKPKPGKGVLPSAPAPTTTPDRTDETAGSLGHIQGVVVGNGGTAQPIPLAEVKVNGVKVYTANPQEGQVFEEEAGNARQDNLSVMHDFGLGNGKELALRVLRKRPAKDGPLYVYLRPGEFFLEGVTAAMVDVEAAFGGKTATLPVRVMKDTIVEDVKLTLPLEEVLVAGPDGKQPAAVAWDGTDPAVGISAAIVVKREASASGAPLVTTTVTYKPDPPDVKVRLRAPAGSAGAVLAGYDLTYEFTTPKRQAAGKPSIEIGPTRVPMPPVTVPRSEGNAPGAIVTLTLPVGSKTLNEAWAGAADDMPGYISAIFTFVDDQNVVVQDKDLKPLRVAVPVRAL